MNQHTRQGRTEDELSWFRRRGFLRGAAAWAALGGWGAAVAQQRSNIVEMRGDALLNGQVLRPTQYIQTGDRIETGPGAHLVFVVGDAAIQLRENTRVAVARGRTLHTVSVLRLLTGAVAAAWGRGTPRQLVTPTLTAGIRGTGLYAEVRPGEDLRTYFCNCYGVIDLTAGREHLVSQADYHQSFWAEPAPVNGRLLTPAPAINHTDEEMEFLARLLGERTPWQVAGRRGTKDGSGSLDPQPGQVHPAVR
ncbi:hypothetical protein GCM10028796_55940 [Ramlibacter monticola]|uniref:Iron dicitrate transport regulator FecR n=1 Tax=Ramlibacter monticola TaxID=1926872 RepID=A0A937CZJ1_9BURK|nr:iron dicitrate transport regulator FecR [Ramlibacter monticola]MBL0395162.1 iron dicitrate transport regulator FecR [Ramlibacter monticola]